MKDCIKCGATKPMDDFYRHPRMADGRLNKCKTCCKSDASAHYRTTVESRREYDRERSKTPARRKQMAEAQRRRRITSPEKIKARNAVQSAIRDGTLHPKPCEVCGRTPAEAHHEDYTKPLQVRWLCRKDHRRAHGRSVD